MILQKHNPDTLRITADALMEGKVVIIPTDTVYGFSGIVPQTDSLIRSIKGREETKPFIQLLADPQDFNLYSATRIPPHIRSHLPGALTVIVRPLSDMQSTVAFRCPDDEWLRCIIRLCGKPLYSTSVNRSGMPVITDIAVMEKEFSSCVFCIVDGGEQKKAIPSTIVDITGTHVRIVRQGAVHIDTQL